jgi:hypothetical protein
VTLHNGSDAKYCLYVDKIRYSPYLLLTVIGRKFKMDGYGTLVRSLLAVNISLSSFPGGLLSLADSDRNHYNHALES